MSVTRSLVYFAYLGEEGTEDDIVGRRLAFVERQLRWLADLRAVAAAPIAGLVPYVAPRGWDAAVHALIARYDFVVDPLSIASDRRNRFEYPGFLAMKVLAQSSAPDDLIYYCHSKGIAGLDEGKMGLFRLHTEVGLTADLARLTEDPALTRAGLFPYRFGWCWYNFFWIKAGYMATLPVVESEDRYDFEALIGRRRDKDAWRGVLSLADRLPFEVTGLEPKPWYWGEETNTPELAATYDRYARVASYPALRQARTSKIAPGPTEAGAPGDTAPGAE